MAVKEAVDDAQDHGRLYGGMLMLRLLTRKYEFKDDTEREPLAQVVAAAFPPLLAVFQVGLNFAKQNELQNAWVHSILRLVPGSTDACRKTYSCKSSKWSEITLPGMWHHSGHGHHSRKSQRLC